MPDKKRSSPREPDPYAADSDHEYTALEADRVDAGETVDDPESIRPLRLLDDEPEQAYPDAEDTRRRERELQSMLEESVNRDPETLAADQARRLSPDPKGDLTPEARRLFENTTEIEADDLDVEDLVD